MPRTRRTLALCACLAALWGCDDTPTDPCVAIDRACDTEGDLRCDPGQVAIEECVVNADECTAWVETETCDGACDDHGHEPLCVEPCEDACEADGASRCEVDVVQTCAEQEGGCLDWEELEDCEASGEVCDESGADAVCVAA